MPQKLILPKVFYLRCNGYHYCTTSFNKAWTQVPIRFKSCSRRVRDSWWWRFWQWPRLEIRLNAFRRSTIIQNNSASSSSPPNDKRYVILKDLALSLYSGFKLWNENTFLQSTYLNRFSSVLQLYENQSIDLHCRSMVWVLYNCKTGLNQVKVF